MNHAVVSPAEEHEVPELVEPSVRPVLEVMRVAGAAAADETGLLGDVAQMLTVAMAAGDRCLCLR